MFSKVCVACQPAFCQLYGETLRRDQWPTVLLYCYAFMEIISITRQFILKDQHEWAKSDLFLYLSSAPTSKTSLLVNFQNTSRSFYLSFFFNLDMYGKLRPILSLNTQPKHQTLTIRPLIYSCYENFSIIKPVRVIY